MYLKIEESTFKRIKLVCGSLFKTLSFEVYLGIIFLKLSIDYDFLFFVLRNSLRRLSSR